MACHLRWRFKAFIIYEFKVIQFHAKALDLKPQDDFRPLAAGKASVFVNLIAFVVELFE